MKIFVDSFHGGILDSREINKQLLDANKEYLRYSVCYGIIGAVSYRHTIVIAMEVLLQQLGIDALSPMALDSSFEKGIYILFQK